MLAIKASEYKADDVMPKRVSNFTNTVANRKIDKAAPEKSIQNSLLGLCVNVSIILKYIPFRMNPR